MIYVPKEQKTWASLPSSELSLWSHLQPQDNFTRKVASLQNGLHAFPFKGMLSCTLFLFFLIAGKYVKGLALEQTLYIKAYRT